MELESKALHEVIQGLMPAERVALATAALQDLMRHTPSAVTELKSHEAVGIFGKYRYQISIRKLGAALAGLAQPLFDEKHGAIFIGLGIIALVAGLDGVARRITLDEAAVCQALYARIGETLSVADLAIEFADLTGNKADVDARLSKAASHLDEMGVVTIDSVRKTVTLQEVVFAGRRLD
jgi:hypothetical protein